MKKLLTPMFETILMEAPTANANGTEGSSCDCHDCDYNCEECDGCECDGCLSDD